MHEKSLLSSKQVQPETIPGVPFPGAPDFESFKLYTKDSIIFHEGILYRAKYNFKAVELFNEIDWEEISRKNPLWGSILGEISEQTDLQETFDGINDEISVLQTAVEKMGRGGSLSAYDFGISDPSQQDLTDYALSQIPSITDPVDIFNGTNVRNIFDGMLWRLTNTPDTDPPIFEWTNQGPATMSAFSEGSGGYIVGAEQGDPPGTIEALPSGKGIIKGWLQSIIDLLFPVGSTFEQDPWDLSPTDRGWGGTWVNWDYLCWSYALSQTAPTNNFINDWKQFRHDIWNLKTDNSVNSDTSKTLKYGKPGDYSYVLRQEIHGNVWTDADLEEGAMIENGPFAGWYIWQVICPAGLFLSVEDENYPGGGFRPPFNSGVHGDMSRQLEFSVLSGNDYSIMFHNASNAPITKGVNFSEWTGRLPASTNASTGPRKMGIDSKFIAPVGPQFSPATVTAIFWRRVA